MAVQRNHFPQHAQAALQFPADLAILAEQALLEPSDIGLDDSLNDLGIDSLGLVENAGTVGAYLNDRMRSAVGDHAHVGEVRGEGMLCAVELVADRDARRFFDAAEGKGAKVVAAMLKRGVIARAMPQGDILGFAPPLCLTREEADRIVDVTAEALTEVLG